MNKIKTRESVKDIKMLDKASVVSERMKKALIRSKNQAENLLDDGQVTPSEYAEDKVQYAVQDAGDQAGHAVTSTAKKAAQKGREAYQHHREDVRLRKAEERIHNYDPEFQQDAVPRQSTPRQNASSNAGAPVHARQSPSHVQNPPVTGQNHGVYRQSQTIKTAEHAKHTIKETARSSGAKTVKTGVKGTVKSTEKTVKTAEQTSKAAIKTAKASSKAAKTAAVQTAKTAEKAVETIRQAAVAAYKSAAAAAKATAAAVKAIIAGTKALISAIATGGWVAVLVIVVITLIAAVAASPFGILFSGDGSGKDTMPASAAIAQINYELDARLESLQDGGYDDIVLSGSPADWVDVLAVYAVKVAGAEDDTAGDVSTFNTERVEKLKNVFFDMTAIDSHVEVISHPDSDPDDEVDDSWSESILYITLSGLTADEAAALYHFSDKQLEMLYELLLERDLLQALIGDLHGVTIQAKDLIKSLPADISPERRKVIEDACSLVGKVNYFWGGKSLKIGWDSRWGSVQKVWAGGSSTTGTYRPFGLDCSGFVDWVFYNASDKNYVIGHGGGAADQHGYCSPISWDDALPGDLVFYPDDEHVGIVAGYDGDGLLIVHCASGYNNVVITDASGFTSIGRPLYFGD